MIMVIYVVKSLYLAVYKERVKVNIAFATRNVESKKQKKIYIFI